MLANRLSANPANSVILLEAGGRDLNPWIHIPVGYFKTIHNPKVDWCYKTEPDPWPEWAFNRVATRQGVGWVIIA